MPIMRLKKDCVERDSTGLEIRLAIRAGTLLELEEVVDEKEWIPEYGGEYFYLNSSLEPVEDTWANSPPDQKRKSVGNCFRTRELAEAAAARVKKALKG